MEKRIIELSKKLYNALKKNNYSEKEYGEILQKMLFIEKSAQNKGFLQFFYGDIARAAMHSGNKKLSRMYAFGYEDICKETKNLEGIKYCNILLSEMNFFVKDFSTGLKYYILAHPTKEEQNQQTIDIINAKVSEQKNSKSNSYEYTEDRPLLFNDVLKDSHIYQPLKDKVANSMGIKSKSIDADYLR